MSGRIFVTGLGVVSPLGDGVDSFWKSLCASTEPPQEFNDSLIGACHMENRKFHRVPADWDGYGSATSADGRGNATRFALHAVEAALRDAGLDHHSPESVIGVAMGTAAGDTDAWERERSHSDGTPALQPFPFFTAPAVASRFGLTGPNLMVSTACSAGGYGISMACDVLRSGWADVMVVGGAEAASRVTQGCFNRLTALDPEVCRPFDIDRKGTIMGEGAAVLILETEHHALSRRRRIYAEVKGWGWSCDGHNPTAPDPSGIQAELALRRSLKGANLDPTAIDCVIPHGTGTALNDGIEGDVISRVFGIRAGTIPVTPIKSKIGHGAGASAAFSCLAAAMILRTGLIPPAGNLQTQDPRCRLHLPRNSALREEVWNILISSYAFGGNNISLVMGKPTLWGNSP